MLLRAGDGVQIHCTCGAVGAPSPSHVVALLGLLGEIERGACAPVDLPCAAQCGRKLQLTKKRAEAFLAVWNAARCSCTYELRQRVEVRRNDPRCLVHGKPRPALSLVE